MRNYLNSDSHKIKTEARNKKPGRNKIKFIGLRKKNGRKRQNYL